MVQTEASNVALFSNHRSVNVIPNPVRIPPIPSAGAELVIGGVGRLVPQKGFDLLIDAFGQLAGVFPQWSVTIWGIGTESRNLIDQRNRLGLRDRIRFAGLTSRPGEWVDRIGIFVLCSRYEGFPNALIEAMAAGLPVIAFDCPWGPSEILKSGEDGLLIPPENTQALRCALQKLMTDHELRRKLGECARRNVARFSEDNVIAKWDSLLSGARFEGARH